MLGSNRGGVGSRTAADQNAAAGGGGGGEGTVTVVNATSPIQVVAGTTTPIVSIVPATGSVPGSMSAADKAKLDAMSTSPLLNAYLPLVVAAQSVSLPDATGAAAGAMSAADKAKLDGIPAVGPARVTALVDQASLSITGLTGATDGGYEIDGEWYCGTAGDANLMLQLNGVTSAYKFFLFYGYNGGSYSVNTGDPGGGVVTAGIVIGRAGGTSPTRDRMSFLIRISPSNGANLISVKIHSVGYQASDGAPFVFCNTFAAFNPGGSPVSSVTISRSDGNATGMKAGSFCRLRKLGFAA